MGIPDNKDHAAIEPLDTVLRRLAEMVSGREPHTHDGDHAPTVEESVRRLKGDTAKAK